MTILGAILGGAAGFAIGGPIGAIVGAAGGYAAQRFGQSDRTHVLVLFFVLTRHRGALADGSGKIQQPTKEFSCRFLSGPGVQ